jgi:hypothetical protein
LSGEATESFNNLLIGKPVGWTNSEDPNNTMMRNAL